MRLFFIVALVCLFCLTGSAQSPQPTPPKPPQQAEEVGANDILRINTTLVGVPVTALDRQGRLVADLKQSDFHIYENGLEQEIAYFAPVEAPVTVLLLFDNKTSVKKLLRKTRETAKAFADQLRPDDKVIAATFGDAKFEVIREPAGAFDPKKPPKIKWRSGRFIHDAVQSSIRYMNGVKGRKAIILFSDGMVPGVIEVTEAIPSRVVVAVHKSTAPERTTARNTLNEAEESDAAIYVMEYDTMPERLRYEPQPGTRDWEMRDFDARLRSEYKIADLYLHALAALSGGRLYPANRPPGIDEAFNRISAELRQQYSLGYYPKKAGQANETRQIKIRVSRPDVVVRARLGYVYAPSKE